MINIIFITRIIFIVIKVIYFHIWWSVDLATSSLDSPYFFSAFSYPSLLNLAQKFKKNTLPVRNFLFYLPLHIFRSSYISISLVIFIHYHFIYRIEITSLLMINTRLINWQIYRKIYNRFPLNKVLNFLFSR